MINNRSRVVAGYGVFVVIGKRATKDMMQDVSEYVVEEDNMPIFSIGFKPSPTHTIQ